MKVNDKKKFERLNIIKAKEAYWTAQEEFNKADRAFTTVGCRHRASGGLCSHSRHMMKKYPGHNPIVPLCSASVCPIE